MAVSDQLSFEDGLFSSRRKISKIFKHLVKLEEIIDWQPLAWEISIIDKTDNKTGGRPRKNPLCMVKATFLQSLFSLSDPQLEDQLIDRLRFQWYVGVNPDQEIPEFNHLLAFQRNPECPERRPVHLLSSTFL